MPEEEYTKSIEEFRQVSAALRELDERMLNARRQLSSETEPSLSTAYDALILLLGRAARVASSLAESPELVSQ